MAITGGAAGRGCGAGAGCGTGAGRGGIPAGRPAVRHGDPSPRIVGRGKGMIGTPGASGAWTGGVGWGAGAEITTGGGAAGFGGTDGAFLAGAAAFGRVALMGFALTFEVVVCPFDLKRRSELSGAPLLISRYRSI
jgi:hypothetical protein